MSEHIVPVRVYVTIFLVLLVGTALTVMAAFQDFPWQLNTIVAMTIAITKATFVVLYFMHVRYSTRLVWVIVASALFWMVILFALTFSDYWTRGWIPLSSTRLTRQVAALFPAPRSIAYTKGSSNEWWRLKF
jgi:cytochrome c oxidase subunit 4